MTLLRAQHSFEQAQQIAEASENSALEFLAAGMAELSKAIEKEFRDLNRKIDQVEHTVRNLR